MSTIKRYDLNPEKDGIIYHTFYRCIDTINDYDQYVKNVISEKAFHYLIIQDKSGNFRIHKSLDLFEDADFFFPNFENVKAVKDYCRINNYIYNRENQEKYKQMVHDNIPLFNQKGFYLIDYEDYNHFFLHVCLIGDFKNPDDKMYNKLSKALKTIMDTYMIEYFEEYKYKYAIGSNNFNCEIFNEIMDKKMFDY